MRSLLRTAGLALACLGAILVAPLRAQDSPGPKPELVIGDADAPVTIVEYASLTCGHCANFHTKVLPGLKEKYLATGKVRLIYRDFPLDDLAMAATLLSRCAATPEKSLEMVGALFSSQDTWASPKTAEVELKKVGAQFGLSGAAFDACFKNDPLYEQLVKAQEHAETELKVDSTPSFFINGRKYDGDHSLDGFDKALQPLIKN